MLLNKLFVERDLSFTVPKMELICVLPYLGKASLDLRTKLKEFTISSIKNNFNPNLGGEGGLFYPPPPVGFPLITQKR